MLIQILVGFLTGTIWSLIWYQLYRTNKALADGNYSIGVRLKSRMHWVVLLIIAYILLEIVLTDVLAIGFNISDQNLAETVMILMPVIWAIL